MLYSIGEILADSSTAQAPSLASGIAQFSRSNAGYFLLHPSGKLGSVMDYAAFFQDVPEDKVSKVSLGILAVERI